MKSIDDVLSLSLCVSFQCQNLKNENAVLKQSLEQLVSKHLEDKRKEEIVEEQVIEKEGGEENVERGVGRFESCREEGEGRVRMMEERERRGEIIGTQREAGVGEEVLHVQEGKGGLYDEEVETKRRGEAEGGQKDRQKEEKQRKLKGEEVLVTNSGIQKHPESVENNTAVHQTVCSLSAVDVEILTNRLKEAQEEADRQTVVAQDLRSKLGEQSRKTWEAEQKVVVLEAELQHLKKAAESLGDTRRQLEVWMSRRWMDKFIMGWVNA